MKPRLPRFLANAHGEPARDMSSIQHRMSKDYNYKSFVHWSQIVCTSLGYESFMNHLETEFSIENLLFVTEVCVCIPF